MKNIKEMGFLVPDEHQSEQDFIYREDSPFVIAPKTSEILELYFRDSLSDPTHARNYLATSTLSFLQNAERGAEFVTNRGLVTDQQVILFQAGNGEITEPEAAHVEAFRYTRGILSVLPYYAEPAYLPMRFSRRGILRPPSTKNEFISRTQEMKRELEDIIHGYTTPGLPIKHKIPLFRTYNFFEVARRVPFKLQESEQEIEEMERYRFEKLLGDIEINLP